MLHQRRPRTKWLLAIGVTGAIGAAIWLTHSSALLPAILLPEQISLPPGTPSLADRVPMSWSWYWRTRDRIFPRKRVLLSTTFIELEQNSTDDLHNQSPVLVTNGVRVWILPDRDLKLVQERFRSEQRILGTGRTDTADEIGTTMKIGTKTGIAGRQREAQLFTEFFPEVTSRSVDLTALFRVTQPSTNSGLPSVTTTNLSLVARLQIPDAHGALLLKRSGEGAHAIIVSASLPRSAKK